ncbi:MAG: HAMP domain-containing sensor histidine kinase, partial [Eubacterium sp.]
EILIVTTNYSHYYSGMTYPPILGQASDIDHLILVNQLFYGFLCCSSLVIALFTLVVWASPAKNRLFFFYGLMALAYGLNVAYSPLRWLGVPFNQSLYALEDCSRYVMIFCIIVISSIISQLENKGTYRYFVFPLSLILCVVTAVAPLFLLPLAPWTLPYYGLILDAYQVLVFIYLMGAAIFALKKEEVKVYFLMAVNGVFGMSLLIQFGNSNRFEPIYTGWPMEYAGFAIVLLLGFMMAWYYRSILLENKKLTENLEEEVSLRTKELTTLMHERKKFLSDLAHDLKAPVSAIQAFIELVKYGNMQVDEELRTYLEIINRKSDEVQNKVKSLQEFTSRDETVMQKYRMDLGELLNAFYVNNYPDTQANGILFNIIKPGGPIWIMGNAEMLERVFENLLYNAMSYTPLNGEITIRVSVSDEKIKIAF